MDIEEKLDNIMIKIDGIKDTINNINIKCAGHEIKTPLLEKRIEILETEKKNLSRNLIFWVGSVLAIILSLNQILHIFKIIK